MTNSTHDLCVGRTITFTSTVILNEAQRSEESPCTNTGVYTERLLARPPKAGKLEMTLRLKGVW